MEHAISTNSVKFSDSMREYYDIGTCYRCGRKLTKKEVEKCINEQSLRVCDECRPQMVRDIKVFGEKFAIMLKERKL